MAEIAPVTSEALEAQIRKLLPSQRGFGEDLQASNVITPIIDLTPAALSTQTPQYLQEALAFGSQTAFDINNTTATLINTTGFYRVYGVSNVKATAGFNELTIFNISDGLATKKIWQHTMAVGGTNLYTSLTYDFVVYLTSGDSFTATATTTAGLVGSTRQVADVNGNLVYPSGYTPQ